MFQESFLACQRKLTKRDWQAALEVVADVQMHRARPGLHVEPIHSSGDLWSARVTKDLRLISLRHGDSFIALYVDHHDAAYKWAHARRVIRDPATDGVKIIYEEARASDPPAFGFAPPKGRFDAYDDKLLLDYGFPKELLSTIRHIRTDDDILNVASDLPVDLQNRLLALAEGRLIAPPLSLSQVDDTALSAQISNAASVTVIEPLRLIEVDDEDLKRVLEAPSDTWIAFLHPSQRGVATRCFSGSARISGGAGTGKTVVAMHRARHFARQGRRVLLASFTNNACAILERGIRLICTPGERERVLTRTVHGIACDIVRHVETVNPPPDGMIRKLIERFTPESGADPALMEAEWNHVIQALGIRTWEEYRDARRTGRGTRLSVAEREHIWDAVIVPVDRALKAENVLDWPDICCWAGDLIREGRVVNPFDAVIVDEMQDLGPQELRFLAALAGDGEDCLTLVGDAGQRIYPNRTTLRDLGIDVRGRTRVLTLNYRTTAQIHRFAEAILGNDVDDLDGGKEQRRVTYSLMQGPMPMTRGFATPQMQYAFVAERIAERCADGMLPGRVAVLARFGYLLKAMQTALDAMDIPARILTGEHQIGESHVTLATIHRAKGMEFNVVFVIGASDDTVTRHLPDDTEERQLTLEQERNLLYVAVTRARDELFITWAGESSRFLQKAIAVTQDNPSAAGRE